MDLRKYTEDQADDGEVETPTTPRQRTFKVTYKSPVGDKTATVTSAILNGEERLEVDRIAARFAGESWASFPLDAQVRIRAMARVTVQLGLLEAPPWLHEWVYQDDALLFELLSHCVEHENTFFRRSPATGEGEAEGRRVEVVAVEPA